MNRLSNFQIACVALAMLVNAIFAAILTVATVLMLLFRDWNFIYCGLGALYAGMNAVAVFANVEPSPKETEEQ